MTYEELKKIDREEAIKIVTGNTDVKRSDFSDFPDRPDVIVFGGGYCDSEREIVKFIEKYIEPKNEFQVQDFLGDISLRITRDRILSDKDALKKTLVRYQQLYRMYDSLFASPTKRIDWSTAYGTYMWYNYIVKERREAQFKNIVKEHDQSALDEISKKIKRVYKFSDREILYLQYFCSQAKRDDLDPSLNTILYLWSKAQMTGKSTVSAYLTSFLNGESTKNPDDHMSTLEKEMQKNRFDIPNAVLSRCTALDEGNSQIMIENYEKFKQMITMNSCSVEFKHKSGFRSMRCFRNYIANSNIDPIYVIQGETERRLIPVHFKLPEHVEWDELEKMWKNFVLECNFSNVKLESIYREVIRPNAQIGDISNEMMELMEVLTEYRMTTIGTSSTFALIHVMSIDEVKYNKKLTREIVEQVLIRMYGEPDKSRRFYKSNRKPNLGDKEESLPF